MRFWRFLVTWAVLIVVSLLVVRGLTWLVGQVILLWTYTYPALCWAWNLLPDTDTERAMQVLAGAVFLTWTGIVAWKATKPMEEKDGDGEGR